MEECCGKKTQPKTASEEEEKHFSYAMQPVNSSVMPMVLHAAIQLDVLEIIAKAGPGAQLSPSEIASRLPANKNPEATAMLDRMLRVLTSFSILTCSLGMGEEFDNHDGRRVYGLAPVATYFLRNQDGVSLGPLMALIQDKVIIDSWFQLKEAIVEGGIPFDRVHRTDIFEYHGKNHRFSDAFNKAMINHTNIVIKKILERYNGFEHLKQVVDVGGGLGVTLSMIISKYPTVKGINFDLPHVVRHAPTYPGVEHVGGNMFESIPRGDTIFMKCILHDWSDDHCLKLLKNYYEALPYDGKVIVVDPILPVIPDTSVAVKCTTQMDLLMMTQSPGGRERTEQEFLTLAKEAGFTEIRMECFACNLWVMEFYK